MYQSISSIQKWLVLVFISGSDRSRCWSLTVGKASKMKQRVSAQPQLIICCTKYSKIDCMPDDKVEKRSVCVYLFLEDGDMELMRYTLVGCPWGTLVSQAPFDPCTMQSTTGVARTRKAQTCGKKKEEGND